MSKEERVKSVGKLAFWIRTGTIAGAAAKTTIKAMKVAARSGPGTGRAILHSFRRGISKREVASVVQDASKVLGRARRGFGNTVLSLFERQQIAKSKSFQEMVIRRSTPAEIYHGYGELTRRQASLLDRLPVKGIVLKLPKAQISVTDLAALTAKTGDEFALFTLGGRRMLIRGDALGVQIQQKILQNIKNQKWKWSAHTHVGVNELSLIPSGIPGDKEVLQLLGQKRSLIANSAGRRMVFDRVDEMRITSKTHQKKTRTSLKR